MAVSDSGTVTIAPPLEPTFDVLGGTRVSDGPALPGGAEAGKATVELKPGMQVGRYLLSRKLGEGGMGVVFVAVDPELQREVALKVLRHNSEGTGATQSQQRMMREAQAMAMLSHPNLVPIYEAGAFEKSIFLAMEFVKGKTLAEWLGGFPPLEDIVEVFLQTGRALQAVHDADLLHRDFKPANVIVTEEGLAKVLDLGIARKLSAQAAEAFEEIVEEAEEVADEVRMPLERAPSVPASALPSLSTSGRSASAFDSELTQEGALVGTPAYMAPEQLRSDPLTPAADQFAFAVSLFEALTGQRPFPGLNPIQQMANILSGAKRPWPKTCEAPEGLRAAVDRALSIEPVDRFDSMKDLLEAIQQGMGIRGQIRRLTETWIKREQDPEYLLRRGTLLDEGTELLKSNPDAFNDEQSDFILRSDEVARRKRIQRRVLLGGLGAVTLGLIPTLALLARSESQLKAATREAALAKIDAVREAVLPLFSRAEHEVQLMYAQREVWLPALADLYAASRLPPSERDPQMEAALTRLNHYFRPVIERSDEISSIILGADDGTEVLFFDDPDGPRLNPPYRFFNRFVHRPQFAGDSFRLYFQNNEGAPRRQWLKVGEKNSRGQAWKEYFPAKRKWFQSAIAEPDGSLGWTEAYLFFITKDAGVTGTVAFPFAGSHHVLGVDFMLLDLSRITTSLKWDDFTCFIVGKRGGLVALPNLPQFDSVEKARAVYAGENQKNRETTDAAAQLPTLDSLELPELKAALRPYSTKEESYEIEYEGQRLLVGRAPLGYTALGLTIYVVQRSQK